MLRDMAANRAVAKPADSSFESPHAPLKPAALALDQSGLAASLSTVEQAAPLRSGLPILGRIFSKNLA